MTRDAGRELADLTAVHNFYLRLLEQELGHSIPTPADLSEGDMQEEPKQAALDLLRRWLKLLERAVSTAMVRQGLLQPQGVLPAEALLRYYVWKPVHAAGDYERTGLLAAFLYRQKMAGVTARSSTELIARFEAQVMHILGYEQSSPPLPNEHRQLAHEFESIREEVEDMRQFDEMMGILTRVRDIKARFGESFYHPHVLATLAEHDVFFGQRFDERFREAVRQIKEFAARGQEEAARVLRRADDDITVKRLAEVEESALLQQEYEHARPQFQRISRYQRAVGRRGSKAGVSATNAVGPPAGDAAPRPTAEARSLEVSTLADIPRGAMFAAAEENKLRGMEGSIRNFARAAEPKSAHIVPLRGSNLNLSAAEVECFRADYGEERSFRADYARLLRHMVAVQGRVLAEMEAFREKQSASYLWKPHADSLAWLIANGPPAAERIAKLVAVAQQRGLKEKAAAINASLQKMREQLQRAAQVLEGLPQMGNL